MEVCSPASAGCIHGRVRIAVVGEFEWVRVHASIHVGMLACARTRVCVNAFMCVRAQLYARDARDTCEVCVVLT